MVFILPFNRRLREFSILKDRIKLFLLLKDSAAKHKCLGLDCLSMTSTLSVFLPRTSVNMHTDHRCGSSEVCIHYLKMLTRVSYVCVYIYTYTCWNKFTLIQQSSKAYLYFFPDCQNPAKYFRIYSYILSVGPLYLARFFFF